MSHFNTAPLTRHLPAVLDVLPEHDAQLGQRCTLYSEEGLIEAWSWLPCAVSSQRLSHRGTATVLEIGVGRTDNLVVGFSHDGDLRLTHLLPHDLCPVPGVVYQTARLVDQLTTGSLRRFVTRALTRKEVLTRYWTSPASRQDHHAYPGGLAEHSLEIAVAVASSKGLPGLYRELGIAYALLHDYGKVWWMAPEIRDPGENRKHEVLGYDMLDSDLDLFDCEAGHLAPFMRELLGGPPVPREGRYPLAIRRVVQAFDQMSCEKTRLGSGAPGITLEKEAVF